MSALRLEGVRVSRGGHDVLGPLDLSFAPGRLTIVIGPNGAGKSTLLATAAGLLRPDAGRIMFGDEALGSLPRRVLATRRAYLPQDARVEWPISVERVVALGLVPQLPAFGGLPPALKPKIEAALADCDLLGLRDRAATTLSGGERARTMLARALVGEPEYLIVDEPSAGLDPRHALDAMQRLKSLASEGRTVIAALHDLPLVARYADRVVGLREGRVVAEGATDEVLSEETLRALFDVETRVLRDGEAMTIVLT